MEYILLFLTFWVFPSPHYEALIVERFDTYEECEIVAWEMWEAVRLDGAVAFKYDCQAVEEREV